MLYYYTSIILGNLRGITNETTDKIEKNYNQCYRDDIFHHRVVYGAGNMPMNTEFMIQYND